MPSILIELFVPALKHNHYYQSQVKIIDLQYYLILKNCCISNNSGM